MTGGEKIGLHPVGFLEELSEFESAIAFDTGIGRSTAKIFFDEMIDQLLKGVLNSADFQGYAELMRHLLCVARIGRVSATRRKGLGGRSRLGREMFHEDAGHSVSLFEKQVRRYAAVDTARHGQQDMAHDISFFDAVAIGFTHVCVRSVPVSRNG
jgi:hypothetical protein